MVVVDPDGYQFLSLGVIVLLQVVVVNRLIDWISVQIFLSNKHHQKGLGPELG